MLYQREPEEILEPSKPKVENRLLKYAKKYEEKRMKLKESIYKEMMQDRPFIQNINSQKRINQSVVDRLYESPHCGNNCGQIEKLVKKSSVRYPLQEIVRPISSQNPYINIPSQQSPLKQSQSQFSQQGKFLENTFSHSQKIKPIRQSSALKFNNNSIHKQNSQNSIIQISMDIFQRKKRSQNIC
ncbi:unnamed protein product [Paramecium primaurelia]|uniref:Uncharacterized protein n=2 Tax=Paramecium TaxID=5884 RepID=A0A8S1XLF7_9CILI|nr:unnamed protein product [Paramecium primaurelia]CAD8202250.1 unnamed protein product [Paramecium pentaurelia]